tara:strand:+ start:575 stop:1678 length:1104 start_codon:yes stop_codon:yes gene_type:complete
VRGKGLLKLPGADWDPLSEDAVLRVGDRVRAKSGTLELVVNRDPKRRAGASRYAGERLILGSGAEVGVAPLVSAAPVDLELLGGKAFALGVERLVLKAGLARVELGAADVELNTDAGGRVKVVVHGGRAGVEVPGLERLELSAGETLRLSPRGVPTRSKTRPRRPKFVSAHESLAAVKQLLYLETFRRWERDARQALVLVPSDPKASPYLARWLTRGPSQLDAKEGVVRGLPGPVDQGLEEQLLAKGVAPMEVRLGRPTDQGGLFSLQAGVRIRVTYRLSGQSELLLRPRLIDPAQTNREDPPPPPDIRAPGRAGLWTQVEFRLDAIEGASAGQVLNYLSFIAGEEGAKGYVLEVKRIVAYVPEPGR